MKIVGYLLLSAFVATRTTTALTPPHPTCYIEDNFDFQGNDIGNVQSETADNCCHECSKVKECRAWSWSNYGNGTCWLKTTKDEATIVVKDGVKSAYRFDSSMTQCELHQDIDYEGNDLVRVDGKAAKDCCALCQQHRGCRAFSWNDYLGGSCFLKTGRGRVLYKQGVVSARAYPVPYGGEGTCGLQFDVDFAGNDIANVPSPTPDECCDICYKTMDCSAYTWTNYNKGTCWLKGFQGDVVKKPGAVSALRYPNSQHVCNVVKDMDFKGGDIAKEPSRTSELCCGICNAHDGCTAYTWSDYNGGTCWLKSGNLTLVNSTGLVSGKTIPYQ